jgi:hypothetical protein
MSKISTSQTVIPDQNFEVILLDENYLNEAVNLLNHTFCTENPVWKHFVEDETLTR